MIAAFLRWLLARLTGIDARGMETQTMIPGLLMLLRAVGAPNIADLKRGGLKPAKAELKRQLQLQQGRIVTEAHKRLEKDGDTAKLAKAGPFRDDDGDTMTGKQLFFHDALWALPRVLVPGEAADILRDDHWLSWGRAEADSLLAGVTDGRKATEIVMRRLIEKLT